MPTTTKPKRARREAATGLRVFVDTNVLLTALDPADPRRERACEVLDEARRTAHVYVSTQVLQEFFNAATRAQRGPVTSTCAKCGREATAKRPPLLSEAEAAKALRALARTEQVVPITEQVLENALEILERKRSKAGQRGIQWYDALIVAAAQLAGCDVLLSRDLQHGEIIGGVQIEDPFRASR